MYFDIKQEEKVSCRCLKMKNDTISFPSLVELGKKIKNRYQSLWPSLWWVCSNSVASAKVILILKNREK